MIQTKNPVYRKRLFFHRVGMALSVGAMSLGLLALLWILVTLLVNGFSALNVLMFAADTPAPGSDGGGLRNAIVGSPGDGRPVDRGLDPGRHPGRHLLG